MIDMIITQNGRRPTKAVVDRMDTWLLVSMPKMGEAGWRGVPYAGMVKHRRRKRLAANTDKLMVTDLPNARGTRLVHLEAPALLGAFERLTLARKAIDQALQTNPAELPISVVGFAEPVAEAITEALIAAALARVAHMPVFKRDKAKAPRLKKLRVLGLSYEHRFRRTLAEARGNALARYLSVLPPNDLTPASYRTRIAALAREHGWSMEFLDIAALKRRGAGAFLAVVQGSPTKDAGIVHLRYSPRGGRKLPAVALVGKGICFDTGGVNVKPNKYMLGMHEDMQGSAVALGTLLALSDMQVDFAIDCWLALAINHIGPQAYKPNDVVTAANGMTIEIVHTDAEGRMVLADTLFLAAKKSPQMIIDYATLTGACVYSLGKGYSGVFSNRDEWLPTLTQAGRDSGERVWPFPQDEDYDHALESPVADVKQCSADGEADHILAARFLRRFVSDDVPWVHIDLSAGSRKGGLGHVPTDTTGFGVRYTCNLLLDQHLLQELD